MFRQDRPILIAAIIFIIIIMIMGVFFHYIVEVDSAEYDGYVKAALLFRNGQVPMDSWHPLFYPLLTAAFSLLFRDIFFSAKLISTLSAGLVIIFTYFIGKECFSRRTGYLAAAAVSINYTVIIEGMHTTTDMLFTAFAMALILLLIQSSRRLTYKYIIGISLLFALCYFTRYTAVAFLPVIFLCIFLQMETPFWKKLAYSALFVVVSLLFLTPQFYFSYLTFGNPFYNDSWKNLAFKLYTPGDWSQLGKAPFHGLFDVIANSPSLFFYSAGAEFKYLVTKGMIAMMGNGWAGMLITPLVYAGIILALFNLDRRKSYFLLFFASFVVMTCFFWTTQNPRHMLPVIPICLILAGSVFSHPFFDKVLSFKTFRIAVYLPIVLLLAGLSSFETSKELEAFISRHPVDEYQAVTMLRKKYGDSIVIAGTTVHLVDSLTFQYVPLEDAFGEEISDPKKYYAKIKGFLKDNQVDYVIFGKVSMRDRPQCLLVPDNYPSFLKPVLIEKGAVVYQTVWTPDNKGDHF